MLYGHRFNWPQQLTGLVCDGLVPRKKNHGDAEIPGDRCVEARFWHFHAIELYHRSASERVREDPFRGTGGAISRCFVRRSVGRGRSPGQYVGLDRG